ncbi:ribose-5-phosphate isomerase [Pseudonocardia phyllosphaerae]|uniref:ribose-5-phosphate isomerase n=1 Tax=Pseudonocardia phyllosphaerae TaxID=3390502 RepID=UPI00397BEDDB
MRVYLGSDHAGFEVKGKLVEYLNGKGYEAVDVGAPTYDALDDYPAWCIETARRVVGDPGSLGIVLGGSGNGEQIAANKVQGIRAALAWNEATASLAREHNDAQVIGVGARQHSFDEVTAIAEAFLSTPFSGDDRHQRRIDQMLTYEQTGEYDLPK